MPTPTIVPSYTEPLAFDRLLLLIATFVRYPGVGCPEADTGNSAKDNSHHDALQDVRAKLHLVATAQGIHLPEHYPSTPTLRKDLELLRKYGILDRRMYRWGYYLGTGAMTLEEFQVAFDALTSQARNQGDPLVRNIHRTLSQRLRGLDIDLQGGLFYPVRQHLNRTIDHADPENISTKGKYKDTLYQQLDLVEQAIVQGQPLELSRHADPYGGKNIGPIQAYPLQLVYHDIAWYLIYEEFKTGHLAIGRLTRFGNYCKVLNLQGRGLALQRKSLQTAHKLLENGWGLHLGKPEEQQAELQGRLALTLFKVRFFPPVVDFILEGKYRHPHHKITPGPKDAEGNLEYVTYQIKLPPRSQGEFKRWVNKHLDSAQILDPPELAHAHREAAARLIARYDQA